MSIVKTAKKLKESFDAPVTDLDSIELINEKGIYQVFEGASGDKVFFGVYLAFKTLRSGGLDAAYKEIDALVLALKEKHEACGGIAIEGINLVRFQERFFIYHIRVKMVEV